MFETTLRKPKLSVGMKTWQFWFIDVKKRTIKWFKEGLPESHRAAALTHF
jgi:hypothetical protein